MKTKTLLKPPTCQTLSSVVWHFWGRMRSFWFYPTSRGWLCTSWHPKTTILLTKKMRKRVKKKMSNCPTRYNVATNRNRIPLETSLANNRWPTRSQPIFSCMVSFVACILFSGHQRFRCSAFLFFERTYGRTNRGMVGQNRNNSVLSVTDMKILFMNTQYLTFFCFNFSPHKLHHLRTWKMEKLITKSRKIRVNPWISILNAQLKCAFGNKTATLWSEIAIRSNANAPWTQEYSLTVKVSINQPGYFSPR